MLCAPFTLVPEDAHQLGDQLSHGASQAGEGQDSATFGGPGRTRVLRTPPPGEGRASFAYEVTEARGVTCRTWESPGMGGPSQVL